MSDDRDSKKMLLELTEEHLDIGMRGIPVGTCRTSSVSPDGGVHYVGYPIAAVADKDPEDIVFLLFNKRLPTEEESIVFRKDLFSRATIPDGLVKMLENLPRDGHPMDWLSIGIHALGMLGKTEDWKEDALNLIAQMPYLMAAIFRIRGGRSGNLPDVDPSIGMVEAFVEMLQPEPEQIANMVKVLRTFLVLHMDHGGGNLSTFTGKAVASGHADLYASMAAAMNALSGPLHGRANQSCLEFVQRIGTDEPKKVEDFVRTELAAKRPIYGFGHAVLRVEDPRATFQFLLGEKICPDDEYFKVIRTLREVAPRVLGENPRISNPNANVDIASGTLLNHVGFKKPSYYTTFFGWARVIGIGAQIVDERTIARNGKGIPIYRPKYIAIEQELK
ncbi:MAG: citrate synthase [Euryarchaeota archaeon]|nr:citrate synthase [Euryarchaeota archaeon]MBT7937542.1 citrate synthase [Euryarchaeota archaeon]